MSEKPTQRVPRPTLEECGYNPKRYEKALEVWLLTEEAARSTKQ